MCIYLYISFILILYKLNKYYVLWKKNKIMHINFIFISQIKVLYTKYNNIITNSLKNYELRIHIYVSYT